MKLSEELEFRGFKAETTIENPESLDTRENKQFYWGADPSADSLTIGNLAALMMCACFVKHGYKPYLLVGGATGQIGDPKETGERDLKPLEEVERNKQKIKAQIERVMGNYLELCNFDRGDTSRGTPDTLRASGANVVGDDSWQDPMSKLQMVDNYDWFKDINYLDFLRTVGKAFSMTQLLDRKFIQNRIGEGGSGISYAEFSYTLIQGYDFYHLYKEYGVALQLCGADQFGNCSSGIHLIKRLENAEADAWSTPLVIDPVSGRKFGKSEGNAVWLASEGENSTTVFDFYQFWLNQPDTSVEYLMKFYTIYSPEEIAEILKEHEKAPEKRIAQKALAKSVTEVVHGKEKAAAAISATETIFSGNYDNVDEYSNIFVSAKFNQDILATMVDLGLVKSKGEGRKIIEAGGVSYNGKKITTDFIPEETGLIKKGKNKIAIVKI